MTTQMTKRQLFKRKMQGCQLIGLGHYAPSRIVSNAEIEAHFGLEPGWIVGRTGIENRRYAAKGETLTDMAAQAGDMALKQAESQCDDFDRSDVGLTILATSTPDHLLPPSGPLLAHKLGLTRSGGIDMAGACAGFLYALTFADGYVRQHGKACLVVAGNILSHRINEEERDSAILFSDAVGAMLLRPCEDENKGVLSAELISDGSNYDLIKIAAGGSAQPFRPNMAASDALMTIKDGRAVFTHAVQTMTDTSKIALERIGATIEDIDHWVPHQANKRIFSKVQSNLDLTETQLVSTIKDFGNSSAGTIPFSLSHEAENRGLRADHLLLFSAVGAGLTGGAVVMQV